MPLWNEYVVRKKKKRIENMKKLNFSYIFKYDCISNKYFCVLKMYTINYKTVILILFMI